MASAYEMTTPDGHEPTEAEAVAHIVRKHIEPKTIDLARQGCEKKADAQVLIVPAGTEAKSIKPFLDEYREKPERRKGVAALIDLDSFIAHANRFKDANSAIFANRIGVGNVSLTSVIDYHPAGADGTAARFGEHRGVYKFPIADEWKTWTESNKKPMSQADFAEFIEANITEVSDPAHAGTSALALAELLGMLDVGFASPSRLLDLSRGLSVRVGSAVTNAVKLSTGEATMNFEEKHTDVNGAQLKIPGAFLLALPIFRNGAPYQVAARLRYRVKEGTVIWWYELHQPDKRLDAAFDEACATAKEKTSLPLFYGSPE